VTGPEDALARAREAAATPEARAAAEAVAAGWHVEPRDEVTPDQLAEWAVLEPDEAKVYSTRRLGAPITLAKQGLLRVLRQYHTQLVSEQTRVNLQLVAYAAKLEARIAALEARVAELEDGRS
jgi:hypothetical protein